MESKIFNDYYVDGRYEILDNTYKVIPTVRNAKNGKLIAEREFTGDNLLDVLDDVSIYIRENIGIIEEKRDFYIDLQLKDFFSSSLKAIEYSMKGNYEAAQAIDSTFAMAYLYDASRKINYSFGSLEERNTIDKAYKYSNKLPLQRQLEIRIRRYIAYEDWTMAEKLLKLQLEIDPSDPIYNDLLFTVYGETKQINAYVKHAEKLFNQNQNIANGSNMLDASLLVGNYKEIISAIENLELLQPNNPEIFTFKLRPQLLNGNIKEARKTQEKTKLVNPEWNNFSKVYDKAIDYLSKNKITEEKLKAFEGLFRSQTSEQTIEYWVNNGILIKYISNQKLSAPILAGKNILVDGNYINSRTTRKSEFLKDSTGKTYAIRVEQFGFNNPRVYWYWSYDDSIKKAERALENDSLNKAETFYKNLIKEMPHHYFFKNVLAHIDYVKSKDSSAINKQYNKIVGKYGPRKFSLEDGKLYYKRESLPKLRIFPISENRYISLTKYASQYGFEETEDSKITSIAFSYDNEKKLWEKAQNDESIINIFVKDE